VECPTPDAVPYPNDAGHEGNLMTYDTSLGPTLTPASLHSTADTLAAPSRANGTFAPPASAARTTILPRVDGDGHAIALSHESRSRYEATKLLGAGGMGEVVLVQDHDIERKVALKRLQTHVTDPLMLARFVDEIRCVGRLEHPNIVPIHDVGVDELGRYFFVMKYVEGETLESIIEKLAAGDRDYHRRYSFEVRVELVIGLLHALEYAHARGIVHRDIKPANVMVGRFGEVVLMDWGIAKPIASARDAARGADGVLGADADDERTRKYATRVGSLIGTPAYMSPEQARGDVDKIDERSDLYSVTVLLHELLGLRHYLADKETMEATIAAILTEPVSKVKLFTMKYPHGAPPTEFIHLSAQGLALDPAKRFQSASELLGRLHDILEGAIPINCPVTFTKRSYRELGRLVDRQPLLGLFVFICALSAILFTSQDLVRRLLPG
jgi:serine/threonine protein kinase